MTQFLPVAPPNILVNLANHRQGRIPAFMLAHEVDADPTSYAAARNAYSAFILDNSVIELGGAVDLDMVKKAAEIVNPRVVVLPDVLERSRETAEATISSFDDWNLEFGAEHLLMVVPQGESLADWVWCLQTIMNEVSNKGQNIWVGIPRNTPGRIVPSRRDLVRVVNMLYPKSPIHLLGFSKNKVDDFLTSSDPHLRMIQSIDSAVPMRVKNFDLGTKDPGRGGWWNHIKQVPSTQLGTDYIVNYIKACQWAMPNVGK